MRLLAALLLMPLLSIAGLAVPAAADTLVRIEGRNFIAPDGSVLQIKGISLGNWLVPEGYMFKLKVANSPRLIHAASQELIDRAVADYLDGIKLRNGTIRWSYLESLGLKAAP